MNIKDIAKLADVSVSTVSKIINHKDESISSETRERVLQIVKEYNYIPFTASMNSSVKTLLLGIIVAKDLTSSPFVQGALKEAQRSGYAVILCESCGCVSMEYKNILALCRSHVDGIIWETLDLENDKHAAHLKKADIPYITLGANAHTFSMDYESLGFAVTTEMICREHRRIACLLSPDAAKSAFLSGYKKCLFENKIEYDDDLVFTQVNSLLLQQIGRRSITSVVGADFPSMRILLKELDDLRYRIPEELSLLALHDGWMDSLSHIPISCLSVPHSEFGAYLCRQLLVRIERLPDTPESFSPIPQLINSYSLAVPPHISKRGIIVVGSLNIDVYLNVQQLPFSGKTVSTSTSSLYPGGKGMNQAAGASRLGHRVNLIGKLGTDYDADKIYAALKEYRINSAGVTRSDQEDTGKAYILVAPNGDSMISILSGANSSLTPEDIKIQEHLFANTGYCLIQTEIPLPAVYEACLTAHRYGAKTIIKPSACGPLEDALLKEIDILVPNEDEIRELCPAHVTLQESAVYLLGKGVGTVIVTLGGKGCYINTGIWEEHIPAASFSSIDNTGASDAFISALASYLLYGCSLRRAVQAATIAAGYSISHEGVIPSLIDKKRLDSLIPKDTDNS